MFPSSFTQLQNDIKDISTNLTTHQADETAHPDISVADSTKWDKAKKIVSTTSPSTDVGEVGDIYFQTI